MTPRDHLAQAQRELVDALLDPQVQVPSGFDPEAVRRAGRSLKAKRAKDAARAVSRPPIKPQKKWWLTLFQRR